MGENSTKLGNVIQIDEQQVKDHLGEIVRGTVEETLNALLDEEADRLCKAKRYERSVSCATSLSRSSDYLNCQTRSRLS